MIYGTPDPDTPLALLVEDDPTVLQMYHWLFHDWGWAAYRSQTVEEAVRLLGPHLDLVVLDLMLPDGRGTEVIDAARRLGLPVPVVVVTGVSAPEVPGATGREGVHVLRKPYVLDDLRSIARGVCPGRRAPRP